MNPFSKLSLPWVLAGSLFSCSQSDPETATARAELPYPRVTNKLESTSTPELTKLHTVDGIFLGGQPSEKALKEAKDGGVRTIINLRHDQENTTFKEKQAVEELGMTYIHLPWSGADELTDEIFDKSRNALKNAEKPILLHCKSANRVGAVWLPYRVIDNGLRFEEALAEAKAIGLQSTEYESKAKDYIAKTSY